MFLGLAHEGRPYAAPSSFCPGSLQNERDAFQQVGALGRRQSGQLTGSRPGDQMAKFLAVHVTSSQNLWSAIPQKLRNPSIFLRAFPPSIFSPSIFFDSGLGAGVFLRNGTDKSVFAQRLFRAKRMDSGCVDSRIML